MLYINLLLLFYFVDVLPKGCRVLRDAVFEDSLFEDFRRFQGCMVSGMQVLLSYPEAAHKVHVYYNYRHDA